MIPIHVVGVGLEGVAGLTATMQHLVEAATLLVGSARHLSYFPQGQGDRLPLTDLNETLAQLRRYLDQFAPDGLGPPPYVVVLASGDPLFFGLGRLLLEAFSPAQLTFHPHLSSVQLAFNRLKLPWQDARIMSAHGRSLDELTQALQQGIAKIAVLTDGTNTPTAIAQLLQSLDLPSRYDVWVCENLGGVDERITHWNEGVNRSSPLAFAPLNVVVLQRIVETGEPLDLTTLPLLGLPDSCFLSFSDRPGLMTKREVRVQILGELGLQPAQTVWDIGAGTGSVAIEIARLCPTSQVYAIEKTAIGSTLIEKNCHRFQVSNVVSVQGTAPTVLTDLPNPDRIFIGGSGGNLTPILTMGANRLLPKGRMLLALATVEHLSQVLTWLQEPPQKKWSYRLVQVEIARSLPIANLTRLSPLNPVTLLVIEPIADR